MPDPEPAPGAYAGVVAWTSRGRFLDALEAAARGCWRDELRAGHVLPDTWLHWARCETGFADHATGRRVRMSVETVVDLSGLSERTVQRCRAVARRLGVYVTVIPGRLLTRAERLQAWALGLRHRGTPGESAFAVPPPLQAAQRALQAAVQAPAAGRRSPAPERRTPAPPPPAAVDDGTQPGSPGPTGPTHPDPAVPDAPHGARRAASPRQHRRHQPLRPGEQLARDLLTLLPWGRRCGARRVAHWLAPFATHGWTATDVRDALDTVLRTLGYSSPTPVRTPWAYLTWLLHHVDATAYEPRPPRPDWCGGCDRRTRLTELPDGRLARCPACHPLTVASPADRRSLGADPDRA